MFVMMYIYPEFIAPIFDTYSPLEDGELKTQVHLKNKGIIGGMQKKGSLGAY